MKRFALLPMLFLLACEGSPVSTPDPQIPTAELKRSAAACALGTGTYVRTWDHYVGTRLVSDLLITFHTTECASDVNVKVYEIHPGDAEPGTPIPDGSLKPIAAADAPTIDDDFLPGIGTPHQARVPVPKYRVAYPEHWDPKYWVEVRSGGKLIGGFRTVDDGTPDIRIGAMVGPHLASIDR